MTNYVVTFRHYVPLTGTTLEVFSSSTLNESLEQADICLAGIRGEYPACDIEESFSDDVIRWRIEIGQETINIDLFTLEDKWVMQNR